MSAILWSGWYSVWMRPYFNEYTILQTFSSGISMCISMMHRSFSFVAHVIIKLLFSSNCQMMMPADRDVWFWISFNGRRIRRHWQLFGSICAGAHWTAGETGAIIRPSTLWQMSFIIRMRQLETAMSCSSEETCEVKFKGFAQLERMYEYAMRMVVEDESDIAFLYRDGAMAYSLWSCSCSIRCRSPAWKRKKFLQEPVVKDLCNIIELLIDPKRYACLLWGIWEAWLWYFKKVLLEVAQRLVDDEHVDVYQAMMEKHIELPERKSWRLPWRISELPPHWNTEWLPFILDKLGYRHVCWRRYPDERFQSAGFCAWLLLLPVIRHSSWIVCGNGKFLWANQPIGIQIRSVASARGMEFSRGTGLFGDRLFQKVIWQEEELQLERRLFYRGSPEPSISWLSFTSKRQITRLEDSFIYELHAPKEEEAKVVSQERPVAQPKKLREGNMSRMRSANMPRLSNAWKSAKAWCRYKQTESKNEYSPLYHEWARLIWYKRSTA